VSVSIITHGDSSTSAGSVVAAIGVFDGVHVGHQALVAATAQRAKAHGVPCAVLTFDRDPDQVVTPDKAAPQLLSLSDKCRFLGEAGADIVIVIPFDTEVARMSPERFVETVLLQPAPRSRYMSESISGSAGSPRAPSRRCATSVLVAHSRSLLTSSSVSTRHRSHRRGFARSLRRVRSPKPPDSSEGPTESRGWL
jgi:uncharacterized protein (DUF58 family)